MKHTHRRHVSLRVLLGEITADYAGQDLHADDAELDLHDPKISPAYTKVTTDLYALCDQLLELLREHRPATMT